MSLHVTPTQMRLHQEAIQRRKRTQVAALNFERNKRLEAVRRIAEKVERWRADRARAEAQADAKREAAEKANKDAIRRRLENSIAEFATHQSLIGICRNEYSPYAGNTSTRPRVTMDGIALEVLRQFPGVTLADIKSNCRTREVTLPRHIIFYQLKKRTRKSLPEIGRWCGRDHTTVLNGYRKIKALVREWRLDDEIERWLATYL